MRRHLVSLLLTLSLLAVMVATAAAGSSFDYGTVPDTPPVGEVNWLGWQDEDLEAEGYPSQVITEDSTNCGLGTDGGYQDFGSAPNPKWIMQVEVFSNDSHGNGINILLGGLGASSGNIWTDAFTWNQTGESFTDQGEASLVATDQPCPNITSSSWDGQTKVIKWSGPPGTYYIYRSQNASGAGNDASNGRYQYLDTVTTTEAVGSYTDHVTVESWHIVVPADSTTGAINGCHSEEAIPTAVTGAPVAHASGPYQGDRTEIITLDGRASFDPGGMIFHYEWQVDGSTVYAGPHPTYDLALAGYDPGTYDVLLRVTDHDLEMDEDATTLTVINAPLPPREHIIFLPLVKGGG